VTFPSVARLIEPVPAIRAVPAAVMAANQFNDPPRAGNQFFIVQIQATYHGTGSTLFLNSDLKLVGASNHVYTAFGTDSRCGVIPDDIQDKGEVFTGATVSGNICFQVPTTEVPSLVMFSDEPLTNDIFLALG
jgi:hypothetical protein